MWYHVPLKKESCHTGANLVRILNYTDNSSFLIAVWIYITAPIFSSMCSALSYSHIDRAFVCALDGVISLFKTEKKTVFALMRL